MKHNFRKSLEVGQAGEALLLKYWPELKKLDGRKGDFELPDGSKMELKSDQYDATKTGNFFIEVYSDARMGSPGSVWQAKEHGCKWFCYWFPKNRLLYRFDTIQLCEVLDGIIPKLAAIEIPNRNWVTTGVLVPRQQVEHLATIERYK